MIERIVDRVAAHVAADNVSTKYPPASENAIHEAEANLGFEIPPLLRRVYLSIGNGGFGPGYGIIGVGGGHASNLGTLVDTFNEIRNGAEYLGSKWNPGLLPFCEWGCNIFSCVDCNDREHVVFHSEECCARAQSYHLEDFFEMWLNGMDIVGVGSSTKRTADIINHFTRSKTRVTGADEQ
jgi:hypothetical protein